MMFVPKNRYASIEKRSQKQGKDAGESLGIQIKSIIFFNSDLEFEC